VLEKLSDRVSLLISETGFTYCNCLFIEDEVRTIIDTGANRRSLAEIHPEKVDMVLYSHHHYDHTRNNVLFSVVFFFVANFVVGLLEIAAMLFIPIGIRITESGVSLTFETMIGSLFESGNFFNSTQAPLSEISIGIASGFADLAAGIGLILLACWLLMRKTSVK